MQLEPDPPRHGAESLLEDAGLIENSLFSSPARKLHLQLLQKSCLSPKLGSALQLRSLQPTSPLRRESNFAASREIAHAKPTEKGGGLGLSSTHLSGLDVPSYSERALQSNWVPRPLVAHRALCSLMFPAVLGTGSAESGPGMTESRTGPFGSFLVA